jgi:hypothetical protein
VAWCGSSLSERKAECKAQEKKLAATAHLAVELAELKASLQDKDREMEAAKADARLQVRYLAFFFPFAFLLLSFFARASATGVRTLLDRRRV